jgi:hypothetical protein
MEPEGSLPHSQVPANFLYSELAQSSPYPHIPLPEDPSEYYPPIYAWVYPVVHYQYLPISIVQGWYNFLIWEPHATYIFIM